MSKRAHRFPPFYNCLASHKRHICSHVLARPHPTTHACQVPGPTLPAHLLSTSARSPHSFQTRFGFLEYILVYSTPDVLLHNCC
ncbi:unnamed protein product [Hymenolepis diminuta]|uniref:Uncharacterized protein n=1 Tax=Hymenolepis diminuta TaxID=6216 RepID=A0A564YYT3_HYMDI|nr:unnamed protein product [Hymenolepis diminuta]